MKTKHKCNNAKALRGNKNRNGNSTNKTLAFKRKVIDARSTVQLINTNSERPQQAVKRLGVFADRAVSGYKINGKTYMGYHL